MFVQPHTAVDIIRFALINTEVITLSQTIYAEDIIAGYDLLNGMLGTWSRNRWLMWHLLDISVPTTTQQSYTIGVGGDFNFPRPDRLEFAFFRQFVASPGNAVDFPLDVLESMEDYGQIALKQLKSWPQAIFYDAAYPLGRIYPVPIPNVPNSELHVMIKESLDQFTSPSAAFNMPPEYFEALWSNLAIRLGGLYPNVQITPRLLGIAKNSLSVIRGANAQIPRLRMPTGMVRPPLFNIYSYQTY